MTLIFGTKGIMSIWHIYFNSLINSKRM